MDGQSTPAVSPVHVRSGVWSNLVAAALLGTERRELTLPPPAFAHAPDGPTDMLGQMGSAQPERKLLSSGAVISLYLASGHLPATVSAPLPEPCEPEDQPYCSERASERLAIILQQSQAELLLEWLKSAAAGHQLAHPAHLPALLNAGEQEEPLRDAIVPVIGKRGRWLAAQYPGWSYVAGFDGNEAVWETGDREARLHLLMQLRARDPARARELVTESWSQEDPPERVAILSAFQIGLSMDDEPFLEEALDDRKKEVRDSASDLLSRLPESRLVARMIERAHPLLALHRAEQLGLFGSGAGTDASRITVVMPESYDKAMTRDGIEKSSMYSGVGNAGWWLLQMLAAIPPGYWSELWNVRPGQILPAVLKSEWRKVLLRAWIQATQRHHDAGWAEALLSLWPDQAEPGLPQLLQVMGPRRAEELVLEIIRKERGQSQPKPLPVALLLEFRSLWSEDFSLAVIDALKHYLGSGTGSNPDWQMRSALPAMAHLLAPSVLPRALEWLVDLTHEVRFWGSAITEFQSLVQARHDMLKEFAR